MKRDLERLRRDVEHEVKRIHKAEVDRATLLAQAAYLGTVGLLLVLPVVAGAYLGRWLDARAAGFEVHWTTSLIVLGVAVGAVNVWLFIRQRM